jgi:hypothetical protein
MAEFTNDKNKVDFVKDNIMAIVTMADMTDHIDYVK